MNPTPPPTPPLTLRQANPGDLPQLLALERCIESAPHWPEPAWADALALATDNRRSVYTVWRGESLLAFVAVLLVADIAEIETLAVAPEARRQGLARSLLTERLQAAAAAGATLAQLELRASNTPALGLYDSLGFRAQAIRRAYYTHPTEDAILMSLHLHPVKAPAPGDPAPSETLADGTV